VRYVSEYGSFGQLGEFENVFCLRDPWFGWHLAVTERIVTAERIRTAERTAARRCDSWSEDLRIHRIGFQGKGVIRSQRTNGKNDTEQQWQQQVKVPHGHMVLSRSTWRKKWRFVDIAIEPLEGEGPPEPLASVRTILQNGLATRSPIV